MNELELILTDIFNCSRTNLYLDAATTVFTDKEFGRLDEIFKQRGQKNPLQYILGYREFMGLRMKVDRRVLIPRPETEILVEAVIEKTLNFKLSRLSGIPQNAGITLNPYILDIGTGSGCIAVSLAKILQKTEIIATDISKEALDLAKENAKLHKVEKNIKFLQADLFDNSFFKTDIKFDIIVSNPPYVPTYEIGIFDKTTLKEPRIALDGGSDGLDFYRRISKEANKFLKKEGFLFLELGYGQADKIKEIFLKGWTIEQLKKDYQGIKRVCIIKRSNEDTTYGMPA